ncbi:CD1247 N-terminal domain-containing protein [Clostridium nigeriense]|uniref:CD1247 N-terminal domain-containing protein n=1 Tax=Clostridium nigeriense TaxID=1805470 RepID=UPI00082CF39B|nr:CD1247 N-terminal domain-containing protein [Clostridium nigeriense]
MKEFKDKIENIKDELSCIEDDKYKNLFGSLLSIIEDITYSIEEMNDKQESLEESVKYIDEDIIGLQDELFEEVSIEDLMEIEEEYVEINCKHCDKPLFVEKESINKNKNLPCPFCNKDAI